MAIGTLADLKTTLGIPSADTSQDAQLTLLLGQVSDMAEDWLERVFTAGVIYTEIYSGNGRPAFALNQRPVTVLNSLWLDDSADWGRAAGAFDDTTLLQSGVDYVLIPDQPFSIMTSASGLVQKLGGVWPIPFSYAYGRISPLLGPPDGNIKVTYTAGIAAPPRLCLAVYQEVALIRSMGARGQLTNSESYGDGAGNYSVSTHPQKGIGIMSAEFLSILARLRNVAVG